MMLTLYNSLSELNEFADEATYRLNGKVEMGGEPQRFRFPPWRPTARCPRRRRSLMAGWWGNMFNRLYLNNVNTPDVKSVNVTVDLLPERRVAAIDSAWVADPEVQHRGWPPRRSRWWPRGAPAAGPP